MGLKLFQVSSWVLQDSICSEILALYLDYKILIPYNIDKNYSLKFDFNIQQNSKLGGSLQYSDKSAKIGLTGTSITSFSESSVNTSTILGIIQVNEKKNYTFELQVVGNQKPSTKDVFAIVIYDNTGNDVYSKIGIITSGELRVQ